MESIYLEDSIPISFEVAFKKASEEGLVSGWANVAMNADGSLPMDWQDDIIPAELLEKAAIKFMIDYRDSGELHIGGSVGTVVESMVFTKEKMAAIGIPASSIPNGWFITVKVNDLEVREKIKQGLYKMFSIQGKIKRLKI